MNISITALTVGLLGLTVSACAVAPVDDIEDETALEEEVSSKDQAIFGSESCKDPQIDIFNPGDFDMRIKALKFYDLTKSTWRSEDVSNTTIPARGGMRFRDNLDNAKDHRIGSWQVKLDDGSWQKVTEVPGSGEGTVLDGYNRKCVSKAGTRYVLELYNPLRQKVIIN